MYRRATTGLENNNDLFSNCSLERMSRVMIAVKNQLVGKSNCFTGKMIYRQVFMSLSNTKDKSLDCSQVGYCGNRNVEENEECDCGFLSECTDPCCYPADGLDSNLACRLKPTAHCRSARFEIVLRHRFTRSRFQSIERSVLFRTVYIPSSDACLSQRSNR